METGAAALSGTPFWLLSTPRYSVTVELISSKNKDPQARFVAETEELKKLEIFMDRRTVELYLNDGEKAGTKIFMNPNRNGRITFRFAEETKVTHISVHRMEAIWTK